jgi:putative modified peptide
MTTTMDISKFADLLTRLAHDDAFRQRFASDPHGTLTDLGIDPRTADVPNAPVQLPSKQALQDEYEARLRRLSQVGTCPMHVLL